MPDTPAASSFITSPSGYQVLARKYRPETFADLIGQDAMVRTLRNAFAADRIAQAFIMTGIRGTGKTSTARIIAKGLNCTGTDGKGGPTTEPCGMCDACVAISAGQHVDVMEMDGASQTGINDIRSNVLESVHYAPTSARYKIYIIDEVHMLSPSAFNALLKTLEEPPRHVKFIFATTEIRKVPVTVLSRCQRFDLRRIEPEVMIANLTKIAALEKAKITVEALALITRAAEGSVRDAQSLLDQAISHGAGETGADQVRAMLGLADRGRVLDMFDMIMKGDAAGALSELSAQYADGADPLAVLRDLAEITHWVSVVKVTPAAAEDPTVSPDERARGQAMAQALPMRVMARMWQMLLKALEEVSVAPNAMMAAEMAVIRISHVADLPTPDDLIKKMRDIPSGPPTGTGTSGHSSSGGPQTTASSTPRPVSSPSAPQASWGSGAAAVANAVVQDDALARYARFDDVVSLIRTMRDVKLLIEVETSLRLAAYAPGRIEFQPTQQAPTDLAGRLGQRLQAWTGQRWTVTLVSQGGSATIAEKRDQTHLKLAEKARANPVIAAIFDTFPRARITDIRTPQALEAQAAEDALPEVEDEWDPFEGD